MGANNEDFQHHIRVYRGIPGASVESLLAPLKSILPSAKPDSPRRLGHHWTTDVKSAERFASKADKGAVLSALVHPDDVMTPQEVEEYNRKWPRQQVYGPEHWEQEVPVRMGATVHITGGKNMTFLDEAQVKNEKQFKTPKPFVV